MAKKIKKSAQAYPPPRLLSPATIRLFVLLLLPWVVMGVVAYALQGTDMPEYMIVLVALAVALLFTFLVGRYVRKRHPRRG